MMTAELKLAESTIQNILKPLGFKKKKLLWWRERGEITQVLGLDKMTYGFPRYNFIFGLLLERFKFPHIPNIAFNGLSISWNVGRHILETEKKKHLLSALEMDNPMKPSERELALKKMIENYALPAFESTDKVEKLRTVLMDKKNILSKVDMIAFLPENL